MSRKFRYSRWRRLPEVFRTGEHKFPETAPETQRITLDLPVEVFETLELLAAKLEKPSVKEYCAELLIQAIEGERLLHQVEDYEARHGTLEGLAEIAEDPEYLSEWEAQSRGKVTVSESPEPGYVSPQHYVSFTSDSGTEPGLLIPEVLSQETNDVKPVAEAVEPDTSAITWSVNPVVKSIREVPMERSLEESPSEIVRRHAGLDREDRWSFLPCLRRGEAVPVSMVDELIESLKRVESDQIGSSVLDRGLSHALYRLAFESQVLLTEAWPGAFDERTVLAIRAVQEAVERILSGPDGRFSTAVPGPVESESLH